MPPTLRWIDLTFIINLDLSYPTQDKRVHVHTYRNLGSVISVSAPVPTINTTKRTTHRQVMTATKYTNHTNNK